MTPEQAFVNLQEGVLRALEQLEQEIFRLRLQTHWTDILRPLHFLYGQRDDFQTYLGHFLYLAARAYTSRSPTLRLLDWQRTLEPDWFQQTNMVGYICYTERFAGNLQGVIPKIPYLQEMGITYLHLMPLLQARAGANDGGYAVANYRAVDYTLGTMTDLAQLTAVLRENGISLCLDLVCNHTAKEHEWAQQALAGNTQYQDYYLMFPDRTMPNAYEKTLPEIFPDWAPGNFTYYEQLDRWVWTTFHEYQWDLNYRNPVVFGEMLDNILFLANQGVEILRLDAVAFMWKQLGTNSQNQPEVHAILQAFRALSRLAAPALILKAEAIVPPHHLIPYLGQGKATNKECQLAYHNVFMVLLWSALAERNVRLMTHVLQQMPDISSGASWVTYARLHDDIGWAITEVDAAGVGLDGYLHRAFLSDFYSGHFPESFARGDVFQNNPKTGDRRISGTLASLAGLELALENGRAYEVDLAIQRIMLLHSLIFAFGGIPLVYMGDEIGLLNDYTYLDDPDTANDNRWLHRPFMNWSQTTERYNLHSVAGRIFHGLCQIINARKRTHALHANAITSPIWMNNDHIFGLIRQSSRGRLLILANFTAQNQTVAQHRLRDIGFDGRLANRLTNHTLSGNDDLHLTSYQTLWLEHTS